MAPISQQGTTIIDDGKQRVRYDPDKKELTIQDSPLLTVSSVDSERRFRLVYRNYNIDVDGTATVASRQTTKVKLNPKSKSTAYARIYWIDKDKAVLLRVDWVDPSGRKQTMSNTISISYPASLPSNTFDKTFVGRPAEVHIRAPARQNDFTKLTHALGFSPINPHTLPNGFLFIGADAIRGRNRTLGALRYTDGAANVTIYQAKVTSGDPPWQSNKEMATAKVDNVWVSVDGDLPKAGKDALLGALKKSGATRGAQLQTRATSLFKASEDTVERLRSMGLAFDDVVACLVVSNGDEAKALRAGRWALEGQSYAYLAREMRVDSSKIRQGIERFWDMRNEN